ncbi:hypothetical protein [Opitutus sp. ER46]|uniref:hypothetical protein n=1 Tax=Opitutus sp. ER46 TaxID=2161864 RepID=UPI000D317A17|nr:hypothetical protein [Opitutus sp. ER46]PTX95741.1 hypothetical protein DB354_10040 [Opitutus sp. ER46]
MIQVQLRNGHAAVVLGFVDARPFALQGNTEEGNLELWKSGGAWREDGSPHPLDIVAVVTTGGQLVPIEKTYFQK